MTSVVGRDGFPDDQAVVSASALRSGLQPAGRLEDGTPYFAPLGELQVVDDGDRVICHLCGRALQFLSAEHLRRHGWTPQAYRSAFGLNRSRALCSPALVERRRTIGKERYTRNARVRDGMAQGQEHARSGRLLELSHATQQPGTASIERRRRTAHVTEASRSARSAAAADRRRARVEALGFISEREYLLDRYEVRRWPVARIKAELGIGSSVLTQVLDGAGIRRRTPGGRGPALVRWRRINDVPQ